MTDAPPCPECAGPWLYSLTYQHAAGCSLRDADDATKAADYERLAWDRVVTRAATPTELVFARALGADSLAATPQTTVSSVTWSITRRVVDGFDPDARYRSTLSPITATTQTARAFIAAP